jgi:hypothetical protein
MGERMIRIAVPPMEIPVRNLRKALLGRRCRGGNAGLKSQTVKKQAEIMKIASSTPSST